MNKPNQPLFIGQFEDGRGERRENFRYGYEPGGECDYPERCFWPRPCMALKRPMGWWLSNQTFVIRTAEVTYNGSLDIEAPDLTSYDLCNSLENSK